MLLLFPKGPLALLRQPSGNSRLVGPEIAETPAGSPPAMMWRHRGTSHRYTGKGRTQQGNKHARLTSCELGAILSEANGLRGQCRVWGQPSHLACLLFAFTFAFAFACAGVLCQCEWTWRESVVKCVTPSVPLLLELTEITNTNQPFVEI